MPNGPASSPVRSTDRSILWVRRRRLFLPQGLWMMSRDLVHVVVLRNVRGFGGGSGRANSRVKSSLLVVVPPLPFPTKIDCRSDNILEIIRFHMTDKVDPDVVFDSLELGIVDPGLLDELFCPVAENSSYWTESQLGLSSKHARFLPSLVNDAMFPRFDTPFQAPLTLVCDNGPVRYRQSLAGRSGGEDDTYTQVQLPSSLATTRKRRIPR